MSWRKSLRELFKLTQIIINLKIFKLFMEVNTLKIINKEIASRENVFYWQTDRNISVEEAGEVWKDRHRYFNDVDIIKYVNRELKDDRLISLFPLDYDAQTSLGNVNSVRVGQLDSGKEIIIRNHPVGIKNGYFHVESLVSEIAKKKGVPSYETFAIYDLSSVDDYSFQVIEKLQGMVVKKYLEENPEKEKEVLFEIGKTMARLHRIKVEGFGPFSNEKAKNGQLLGIHSNYELALKAGLDFNCDVLVENNLLNLEQKISIKRLFKNNKLLEDVKPVLIHNDFADWNLLIEDGKITGVLDFDECVAGDPISDIACWSTFFAPERLEGMLEGYWAENSKPNDFEEKFELFRLRYVLSKMTLRLRRYNWQPTEFMKGMIEKGTVHLSESLKYFNI